MRRRLLDAAALLAVLGAGGLLLAVSGLVPVKASSGHWPPTQWFLTFSMRRSIATHSLPLRAPPGLDDPVLALRGAGHFETSCRSCHGAPDLPQSRIARAMLPRPPQLGPRVRERSPEELFFVIKHGLKFTGMPAWTAEGRDDEVWAMVAFLLKLPALDKEGYRRLVRGEPGRAVAMSQQIPAAVSQTCARCHGAEGLGRGPGAFPRLAGQSAEYLAAALEAYARGARRSGMMEPIAAGLSPESVRELSDYYASLPAARAAPRETDAASIARGAELARRGVPSRRVPACAGCHGLERKTTKGAYPALAGLSAGYLRLQLELFAEGRRGGSAYVHLMQPVARAMRPGEMRDAALYYESLVPARR